MQQIQPRVAESFYLIWPVSRFLQRIQQSLIWLVSWFMQQIQHILLVVVTGSSDHSLLWVALVTAMALFCS